MMLSEGAEGMLSFLEMTPAACENCVAAYLRIDRYDALKATRELILAGRILCTYDGCPVCKEPRLVARLRPGRPLGSRRPRP